MSTTSLTMPSPARQAPASSNAFARALGSVSTSELEKNRASSEPQDNDTDRLREAMMRSGGAQEDASEPTQEERWAAQQEQFEKQRRAEALRRRQEEEAQQIEIYNAREAQTTARIENTRQEIRQIMASRGLKVKETQAAISVMTQITSPGVEGVGYSAYYAQLRSYMLLRAQQSHSSATWATELHTKKGKKQQRNGINLASTTGYEETATVHNISDNHELNRGFGNG